MLVLPVTDLMLSRPLPYTLQNMSDVFLLSDLGVVTLRTTLNFGNFIGTTLTKSILPFIVSERGRQTTSSANREKSQYRVFFSDGYALYCTIVNQQYLGAMPVLLPNPALNSDVADLYNGGQATYFASNDGGGSVAKVRRAQHAGDADVVAKVRQADENRSNQQNDAAVQDLRVMGVLGKPPRHEFVPSTPARRSKWCRQ